MVLYLPPICSRTGRLRLHHPVSFPHGHDRISDYSSVIRKIRDTWVEALWCSRCGIPPDGVLRQDLPLLRRLGLIIIYPAFPSVGLITSVSSNYYYNFPVIRMMWEKKPQSLYCQGLSGDHRNPLDQPAGGLPWACVLITLWAWPPIPLSTAKGRRPDAERRRIASFRPRFCAG